MAFSDYVSFAALLDDFNRASLGSDWIGGFTTAATQMQTYTSTESGRTGAGFGSSVWKDQLSQDGIVIVEIGSGTGDMAVDFRADEINSSNYDSIELNYTESGTQFDLWVITNNSAGAALDTTTSFTLGTGDLLGIAGIDDLIICGINQGSGWTDLLSGTDPAPQAGYHGWWANGTNPRITNYFAGNITAGGGLAWITA